ncbi:MAG: AbrB/MazE/SpoVT family DNA-binding domain-containing protein [Ruminococcus sp.]|nr:AbrB/MazE/SpoVT family DNA-binding domain-containing protein [Ruminococcus sp.]
MNEPNVVFTRVLPNGSIVIPKEMRTSMKISIGDNLVLVKEDGDLKIKNRNIYALEKAQKAMAGEDECVGLTTEDSIIELCREVRYEMEGRLYEGND